MKLATETSLYYDARSEKHQSNVQVTKRTYFCSKCAASNRN